MLMLTSYPNTASNEANVLNPTMLILPCVSNTTDLNPETFCYQLLHRAKTKWKLSFPVFLCEQSVLRFVSLQLDFALWLPNCPAAMMRPPPQAKGAVTEQDILSFLPDINSANRVLMTLAMLSQPGVDFVRLHPARSVGTNESNAPQTFFIFYIRTSDHFPTSFYVNNRKQPSRRLRRFSFFL